MTLYKSGLSLSRKDTEDIFVKLRNAQHQIVLFNVADCSEISTAISNAIVYMTLLENEIYQLRIENKLLKIKEGIND
jgi:hypothetical protein